MLPNFKPKCNTGKWEITNLLLHSPIGDFWVGSAQTNQKVWFLSRNYPDHCCMGQLDSSPNNKLFLENRGFILLCGMREGFSLNLAPFRKDYPLIAIGVGRHRQQWKAFILQSFQPASDSSMARRWESPQAVPNQPLGPAAPREGRPGLPAAPLRR